MVLADLQVLGLWDNGDHFSAINFPFEIYLHLPQFVTRFLNWNFSMEQIFFFFFWGGGGEWDRIFKKFLAREPAAEIS